MKINEIIKVRTYDDFCLLFCKRDTKLKKTWKIEMKYEWEQANDITCYCRKFGGGEKYGNT